jgi:glycosyltransferase involved in cell wall biosynthesis
MRLAILAHNLRVGGGLVVGRNIVATLPQIAPEHDYLMVVPDGCGFAGEPRPDRVRFVELRSGSLLDRLRVERSVLPKLLRDFAPDWIWALGNVPVRAPGCRQALLVHDPHLFYPRRHYALETPRNRATKQLLRWHLGRALGDVDVVFCQTESARRRFAAHFPAVARVASCPVAVSRFAAGAATDAAPPAALRRSDGSFRVLILTRYYAHKNLERVVEAFDRFRAELAGVTCILTIAPEQHPRAAALLETLRARGLEERIVNIGPLRQDELAPVYRACDALLHPTLLESFSSAYLEAMHFGLPILTSDLDFAREVCGDAASYFDPWNAAAIKDAVLALRADPARSVELVRRGAARLATAQRGWPEIVAHALDVLAGVGAGARGQEEEGERSCRSASIRAGVAS